MEKDIIRYDTNICENISDGKRSQQKETNETNTNISNHLEMIYQSIKPSTKTVTYTNTCAVDNILFSLYYLVHKYPVAMSYIKNNVKSLYETIKLLKEGHIDMARIIMI